MRKELSQAAQWFLKDFERIIEDFCLETQSQIALLNKEGELIINFSPKQKICQLIWQTEKGKMRCLDHFKIAFSVAKSERKTFLLECYAGFSSIWMPIIIGESFLGVIVNCGGRIEKGESEVKLKTKFSKLALEIEIFDKEKVIQAALETPVTDKQTIENRMESLKKLIEILKEHTLTPLKEVFG